MRKFVLLVFYGLSFLKCVLLFGFYLTSTFLHAGTPASSNANSPLKTLHFIENKNQWDKKIYFKLDIPGGTAFFEKNGVRYVFYDQEQWARIHEHPVKTMRHPVYQNVKSHSFFIKFLHANENVKPEGQQAYSDYKNYFLGNNPARWAGGVPCYSKIVYRNIYPGIDLIFTESENTLKYELVLKPGSDPEKIKFLYDSPGKIYLKNEELKITTTVNEVTEKKPVAYLHSKDKMTPVDCQFLLKDSLLSFKLPEKINATEELVIDPVIVFSTYSGSLADNWGYTATYDVNGSLYAGGIAFDLGYPTTAGAFQQPYGGDHCDVSITKFSQDGKNLIYSTYLGGNAAEQPHSMFVTASGELTLFGTTSSANFPVSQNAFQGFFNSGNPITLTSTIQFNQGSDLFVTKFSQDGKSIVGSTFFGGTANDGLNVSGSLEYNYGDYARGEIFCDALGNSYIASCTHSTNITVSAGAFQSSIGGSQDAVIFCLNQDLSALIYCSYLGGGADDAAYGIRIDSVGNVFVSGGTNSSSFPGATGGLNGTYLGGQADGFIAKINADFSSLIQSTYLGTSEYDQAFFVDMDDEGYIYTYGQTKGNYSVSSGVYFNINGRQFIHKLSPDLKSTMVSTVFGSGGTEINLSPSAFMVDQCKNIYISGWGGEVNGYKFMSGMSITPNAFQPTTDGSDFYFMVLSENAANLYYATYFGSTSNRGEHVDGGTSRFDPRGLIYQAVCAGCGNSDAFPTTPGVWSRTNNSDNCNLAALKFDLYYLSANIIVSPSAGGCAPFNVQLTNNAPQGLKYEWDLGDNSTDTNFSVTHTYQEAGTYQVRLIVTDTTACYFTDTAVSTVTVFKPPTVSAGNDTSICNGDTIRLKGYVRDASSYEWTPAIFLADKNDTMSQAFPPFFMTYTLNADSGSCSVFDRVNIYVLPPISLSAGNDTSICQGTTLQLSATGAANYVWHPGKNFNDSTISNPTISPDSSMILTVTGDSSGSCTRTDTVRILITPLPSLTVSNDTSLCRNDTIQIFVQSDGISKWYPNIFISDTNANNPLIFPDSSITYRVLVSGDSGCTRKDSVSIFILSKPEVTTGFDQWICSDDSVKLVALGAISYDWSPAAGLSKTNTGNPSALPAISTLYSVTGVNASGCDDTDSVWVFIDSVIPVDAGADKTICKGFNALIGGKPTAPEGVSILWKPDNTLSDKNAGNPVATPTIATQYLVTASSNNCSVTDTVNVTINASPQADFTFTPACLLDTMILTDKSTISEDFILQRKWYFGDGDSSLSQNAIHIFKPGESDSVWLIVTSDKSCTDTIKNKVTIYALPDLTGSLQENIKCFGECNGKITVNPVGGKPPYMYSWQGGQSTGGLSGLCPGLQRVFVSDSNQCKAAINFNIAEPLLLEITKQRSDAVCLGDCNGSIEVAPTGGTYPYSYFWSDTNLPQDSLQNALCPGTYFFTVTDDKGCSDSDSAYIKNIKTLPIAEIKAGKDSIFQTETINLQAVIRSGYTYRWEPAEWINDPTNSTVVAAPMQSVVFHLTVTDESGCRNYDSLSVFVKDVICAEPYIYIPNAFSPNDDTKNDVLFVRGNTINDLYFAIYDRWGNRVFETNDKSKGWDGKINSKEANAGVYVYYLKAGCVNGETFTKKGNVTVLR